MVGEDLFALTGIRPTSRSAQLVWAVQHEMMP